MPQLPCLTVWKAFTLLSARRFVFYYIGKYGAILYSFEGEASSDAQHSVTPPKDGEVKVQRVGRALQVQPY